MSGETYLWLVIALMAALTFASRALPFWLLRGHEHPLLMHLGRYLPPVVMTLLVAYSVKDASWTAAPHGLPELAAIALTAVLHLWRRNALLSIGAGTGLYMWLQQAVLAPL